MPTSPHWRSLSKRAPMGLWAASGEKGVQADRPPDSKALPIAARTNWSETTKCLANSNGLCGE